jgi:hypothetical protein
MHRTSDKVHSAKFMVANGMPRRLGIISGSAGAGRRSEGGDAYMDSGERGLYYQIHPAKLATDIGAPLVSTYLMWRRRLVAAMLAAFVPAGWSTGCWGSLARVSL